MSFKLSKRDSLGKTELLAQAREKHIVVCAQIDAFNAMMEAARESIEGARKEYAVAVGQLQDFAAKTARTGSEALHARGAGVDRLL
jgi:predicted TIM-barrel fold metal-dependent hydrolase